MTMQKDAFISGLDAFFADNPQLKPANVSERAGLHNSTIRKILKGDETRAPRMDTAEKIAAALGTTVDAIRAYKPGGSLERPAPPPARGFSEDPVAPWTPPPNQPDPIGMLAPHGRNVALYRLGLSVPTAGLCRGDILAVDLGTLPKDGDTILAGITDLVAGTTRTEVRRFFDGLAVSTEPGSEHPVLRISGDGTVVWRGTVAGMMRLSM